MVISSIHFSEYVKVSKCQSVNLSFKTIWGKNNREEKMIFVTLKIPAMLFSIDIPFAAGSLPVCGNCRRNKRSKEFCREQCGHSDLPWSDTFICVSIDSTCFMQDSLIMDVQLSGELSKIRNDICFTFNVDQDMSTCLECNARNKTREYCREHLMHRGLPYCTSYATIKRVCNQDLEFQDIGQAKAAKKLKTAEPVPCPVKIECDEVSSNPIKNDDSRFFDYVHESRTFLCIVSESKTSFQWLCAKPGISDNKVVRIPRPIHSKGFTLLPRSEKSHDHLCQLNPSPKMGFMYAHEVTSPQTRAVTFDVPKELNICRWLNKHDQTSSAYMVSQWSLFDDENDAEFGINFLVGKKNENDAESGINLD